MKTDKRGRPYARKVEVTEGTMVEVDGDFTCMKAGEKKRVQVDPEREGAAALFIPCADGHHFLDGQSQGGHYLGIYLAEGS